MSRLNNTNLAGLPSHIIKPNYNRAVLKPRILHLGVGAFHRAHQAFYTESVLNQQGGDWGVLGASLRSAKVGDQLNPQDGLYTVVEQSQTQQLQIIGCLLGVINAGKNPAELIAAIASEDTKLVSLTVTEKAYCHDPATGQLQLDNSVIAEDLTRYPDSATTAIGFLVCGLKARKEGNRAGITLLSCDNLPNNGEVLKNVVLAFAKQVDAPLAQWIETNICFPCSMVDRIVPATTEADLQDVEQALSVSDHGAIFTEPFTQWVIENNFANAAPDWASAGALLVDSVTPFEKIKLRLLNGSHSIIAYLGYLAGYDYVHETIADPAFKQLIQRYMDELVTPTLDVPEGFDLSAYKQQLIERFANPALNHRTQQIAMDGSQKIPQRWLSTLADLTAQGANTDILALAIAGWIRFLEGVRDSGERYSVDDPMTDIFAELVINNAKNLADEVLSIGRIFGKLSSDQPAFCSNVSSLVEQLRSNGVVKTIQGSESKDSDPVL